jgi:hypothetical protein
MAQVTERIHRIQERIDVLRPDHSCRLMAVTKGQGRSAIDQAIAAGVRLFGENRVQEALTKWQDKRDEIVLHLIGHLQSNKVKYAIRLFSGIDTVDSVGIAEALDRRTSERLSVMAEVNIGREISKTGLAPDQTRRFLSEAGRFNRLSFDGILAILPQARDSSLAESKRIRDLMQETAELWRMCQSDQWPWAPLHDLSMGMTHDYEWALEAGATVIRVGEGIFGLRT